MVLVLLEFALLGQILDRVVQLLHTGNIGKHIFPNREGRFDHLIVELFIDRDELDTGIGNDLLLFVLDILDRGPSLDYLLFAAVCLVLIFVPNYWQYNATFFATYVESGKRRVSLAEKLRKLPLSFFGKKDLLKPVHAIDQARTGKGKAQAIPCASY